MDNRDNLQAEFFEFAEKVGLGLKVRLEALRLGPSMLEEALRRTARHRPENQAAYFTTVQRNLLAAQKLWRSELPLEQRLAVYVRAVAEHYDDGDLREELAVKGADEGMIGRLLAVAEERRAA